MADSTTPLMHLTVPATDGSDDIGDWPGLTRQGLIDLENTLILGIDSKVANAAYSTYPIGLSTLGLSLAGVQNSGWPGIQGMVLSMRRGDGTITYQIKTDSGGTLWSRFGSASGWSDWISMFNSGQPVASASGTKTFSNAAAPTSITVAFPAGRFTATPIVTVSTHDRDVVACVTGKSATGFTLLLGANGGASTFPNADYSVDWIAIQNN